jgi:hypothetical protein
MGACVSEAKAMSLLLHLGAASGVWLFTSVALSVSILRKKVFAIIRSGWCFSFCRPYKIKGIRLSLLLLIAYKKVMHSPGSVS